MSDKLENQSELNEFNKSVSAMYKYLVKNPNTHRNILRKELFLDGKVSKTKFPKILEGLIALGTIKESNQILTINPEIINIGVLRKNKDNEYYVVTPNSKKRFQVPKSIASNYRVGELLDVVVDYVNSQVIVLGKAQKEKSNDASVVDRPRLKREPALETKVEDKKPIETKVSENNQEVQSQTEHSEKQFVGLNSELANVARDNILLGRVVKLSYDDLVFIPNKKSILPRQIPIKNDKEDYASFQDKICTFTLINPDQPSWGGYVVSVKGDAGNPIHEYDAIAENYGAIMSWTGENIEREIEKLPTSVDVDSLKLIPEKDAEFNQRGHIVDLRNIPFTTVDPATCKDMDDAIYSTFNENGDVVCYTAVANVTKYVDLNSEIGQRYINGAFTIYAPNKAYNILPTKLSTGICSLNPDEDRLAIVVKTVIDGKTGEPKESLIMDSIIRSRKKYSYEEAQEIIDNFDKETACGDIFLKILTGQELTLDEQLLMNYYAGQTINIGFDRRKMLNFDSKKEREVIFDNDLKDVVDIKPVQHLMYHDVIKAFMITANESTAKFALDNELNIIYRVHEAPNPRKIDRANEFFDILGIDFDGSLSVDKTFEILDLVRGSKNEEVINDFLIRSQTRADYSDHPYSEKSHINIYGEKISHHGLQSPWYSHMSAAIRRVVDYATHYNVLAKIHGTKPLSAETVKNIIEIANERQLDVDQAEKDYEDIDNVFYCEKHIGEQFKGRIIKIRQADYEEGYNDEYVVVVKNDEKGVTVEIPLSQVLGKNTHNFYLSAQRCAVFDSKGNTVLTLCKPLDFIIESADRKTMTVVGKTNRELVHNAELRENFNINRRQGGSYLTKSGKQAKVSRYEINKKHKHENSRKTESHSKYKEEY